MLYNVGGGISTTTSGVRLDEKTGNHYLDLKGAGGSSLWPYFDVYTATGKELTEQGTYTIFCKFYVDSTAGSDLSVTQLTSYYGYAGTTRYSRQHASTNFTISYDKWYNASTNRKIDGVTKGNNQIITDYWQFYFFSTLKSGASADKSHFYIDDIALYFKPATQETTTQYTVTFNGGSQANASVPAPVAKDEMSLLALSDYTAYTVDGYTFDGWSRSVDGAKIDTNLYVTNDMTLYALWTPEKLNPLHGSDFNSSSSGQINNFGSSTNNGHTGGSVTGALATTDDGIGVFKVTLKAKDAATSTDVGDPIMYDSTVSSSKVLYTDNVSSLEVRYRIKNAPSTFTSTGFQTFFNVDDGTGKMLGLGESRSVTKLINPSDTDWQLLKIDLSAQSWWNTATVCNTVRFDPISWGYDGMEIEFDYVKYLLADGVKVVDLSKFNAPVVSEANGTQTADYRPGTLTYKFDSDIGIAAADFYNAVALDSNSNFNGNYTTYDPNTFTYTLYAESLLKGKTYSTTGKNTENSGLIILNNAWKYSFKYSSGTFDDGENLMANGDFKNPYYKVWPSNDKLTTSVSTDGLLVTLSSPSNQWTTLNTTGWSMKPDTKYYVDIKFEYKDTDTFTFDPAWNQQQLVVYAPQLDGFFSSNNANVWSYSYSYIPSVKSNSFFYFSSAQSGKTQSVTKVMSIENSDYYSHIAQKLSNTSFKDGDKTATSLVQLAVDNGYAETTDNSWYSTSLFYQNGSYWNGSYSTTMWTNPPFSIQTSFSNNLGTGVAFDKALVTGLSYTVKSVVIKEMYDLTFDVGENASNAVAARYAAKDIAITLPAAPTYTDGKIFLAWQDSTGTQYEAGAAYSLATAGDMVFTALVETPDYAPTTSNLSSIRLGSIQGLRYMASVTDAQKSSADEYGFIVARRSALTDAGKTDSDLSFECGVTTVNGVSYNKSMQIDKVYGTDDENGLTYFTGVLVGIPQGYEKDILVARPYVKIGNTCYYGDTIAKSIYEIAVAIRDSGYSGIESQTDIDAIDAIISSGDAV